MIDASLRLGLILRHQPNTQSSEVLEELLFQSTEGRIISERMIYQRALDQGIIGNELFSKLVNLYQQRNRVVHRYIISELTTDDVLNIALAYEKAIQEVSKAVGKIEEGRKWGQVLTLTYGSHGKSSQRRASANVKDKT